MGLFDKIKEIGGALISGVVNLGKKVINYFTGSNDTLNKGRGEREKFTPKDPGVVVDYASLTNKYLEEIGPLSDEIEGKCIDIFKSYFTALIEELKYPNDKAAIENKFHELIASTQGTIKTYISIRCSSDNIDLREILQMPPGIEKEKKSSKYQRKVVSEAVDGFCDEVRKGIKTMTQFTKEHFERRITNEQIVIESSLKTYNELEKNFRSEDFDIKANVLKAASAIAHCDYFLDEFNK